MRNKIKTILLVTAVLFLLSANVVIAQKYCFVNSEYILGKIPAYNDAQKQLDALSVKWQREIEEKYSQIDKLYKAFQAEQILLTEEMKKRRQDEILTREREVKDLQKQRFGYEGDLFKKKQELVKPIQDKVYNAVKKYATDQSYSVIFDKSSDLTMLYANPKYDKSDAVLKIMGIKPDQAAKKESTGETKETEPLKVPPKGETVPFDRK
ncbi:MAG TPA: OmpH family outer membrane protein [Bacteroidia bacterium]|nr:OmpH family outer membrane protein [Bacteroidia bacterium]